MPRTGNRDYPGPPGEQPSKGDLRRRRLVGLRDQLDSIHQSEVCLPQFRREAWDAAADIGAVEGRIFVDLAGKKTFTEGTIGNKSDTKFLQSRIISSSGDRHHMEYSLCTAVTGWTAWAW